MGFHSLFFFLHQKKKEMFFTGFSLFISNLFFFFSLPKGIFYLKNLFAIQDFIFDNLLQTINCLSSVLQTINNDFFVYVCV